MFYRTRVYPNFSHSSHARACQQFMATIAYRFILFHKCTVNFNYSDTSVCAILKLSLHS